MPQKFLRVAAAQLIFRRTLADNLESICRFIARAARADSDVVLFPECALTGYNIDFRKIPEREVRMALDAVADAARLHQLNLLVGAPAYLRGQRYNSLHVIDRRGRTKSRYAKIHLTSRDAEFFAPGNSVAFFRIDDVPCTAIICHERRYPELVRIPVMMGAQIIFHPNAGLDSLKVSKSKRGGRDGIAVRAFENQVFYVFANSVGPQGGGLWSAGDSKIVAPDSEVLAQANNSDEMLIHAKINLSDAKRRYAREALSSPAFLRSHWKKMLSACREQLGKT